MCPTIVSHSTPSSTEISIQLIVCSQDISPLTVKKHPFSNNAMQITQSILHKITIHGHASDFCFSNFKLTVRGSMSVGHYWHNTLALSRWHILQPENALKYGTCAALFNIIIYHYNRFHVWSSFPLEEYGYDDKYSLSSVILLHYWLRLWWNIRKWANAVQAVYNKAWNIFHSDTVFAYVDTPPYISIFYTSHGRHGIRMSAPYPLPPEPPN